MCQCKVIVVDDVWTSVGSTNFDDRSLMFNDEANLNVYDIAFARTVNAAFAEDLQRAKRVSLEAWQARPWLERIREWADEFFHSQL